LADHFERVGVPPVGQASALIPLIERAGLRGKGGAGFPTAVKLAAVANRGRGGSVVVNGTEGEPASAKDKTLLASAPHLVLDGAMIAAQAVGARQIVVCVDRRAAAAGAALHAAVAERQAAGLDGLPVRLASTPSRYLTGEESALIHWINGGEAKPTFTPPRPFERGVGGRPTLVQNVETLAHLALIARFGDVWFRSVGTAEDPGTTLVTLSGVARPQVFEVAGGTPVSALLGAAGVAPDQVQALLVGGYFGTWLAGPVALEGRLGAVALDAVGGALGCGAIAVLSRNCCGLAETARLVRWLAAENAGQCGPCVHGLPAIAGSLDRLVAGDVDGQAERQLKRWLTMVNGRGACRLPDGVVRLADSALRVFAEEVVRHRRNGPCRPAPSPLVLPAPEGWR
jgi:NADH:ubiquinone oxidoreductase subunit F (NADH-binding)